MPALFVGHQGPPNPAAFPDEVFNPTLSRPLTAPETGVPPAKIVRGPSMFGPIVGIAAAPYDPTAQPPQITSVGLQGYVRRFTGGWTLAPNFTALTPDYDPTTSPPQLSTVGFQDFVKLRPDSWTLAPSPSANLDPTTMPPAPAQLPYQNYPKRISASWTRQPDGSLLTGFDPTTVPPPLDLPSFRVYPRLLSAADFTLPITPADSLSWLYPFRAYQFKPQPVQPRLSAPAIVPTLYNPALLIYPGQLYHYVYARRLWRSSDLLWVNIAPVIIPVPVAVIDFPPDGGAEITVFRADASGLYVPQHLDGGGRYNP